MRQTVIRVAAAAAITLASTSPAWAGPGAGADNNRMMRAEEAASEIINMRSVRAREFIKPGMEITPQTFLKVCGAVGKRAKEIASTEGFVIRHAAARYRNPANAATSEEVVLIRMFAMERSTDGVWDTVERDGAAFKRFTKPIYVEPACMACHGAKDERPGFIKKKYPDDTAFGFNPGDVRGIISVLVPAE